MELQNTTTLFLGLDECTQLGSHTESSPLLNKPVMITGLRTVPWDLHALANSVVLNAPEIKANVLPDEFLLSHSYKPLIKWNLVDLDVKN